MKLGATTVGCLSAAERALVQARRETVRIHLAPRDWRPFSAEALGQPVPRDAATAAAPDKSHRSYPPRDLLSGVDLTARFHDSLHRLAPADKDMLAQFLHELSAESFSLRFPHVPDTPEKRTALATHLLQQAQQGHSLFTLKDDDGRVAGLLDYKPICDSSDVCEVDLVVADQLKGQGMGSALLAKARELAKQDGYRVMRAVVAHRNTAMLDVLGKAGVDVSQGYANLCAPGHTSYEIDLQAAPRPSLTREERQAQRVKSFMKDVQLKLDGWAYANRHRLKAAAETRRSGMLDDSTRQLLEQFQADEGLAPSGRLTRETLERLEQLGITRQAWQQAEELIET